MTYVYYNNQLIFKANEALEFNEARYQAMSLLSRSKHTKLDALRVAKGIGIKVICRG